MSYPINYPTPQGANIQIFQGIETVADWVKPQGASFVWFTLIGAGGDGGTVISDASAGQAGSGGGGSGAVTNCMIPAFLIPDILRVQLSKVAGSTTIGYQQKNGGAYTLLQANNGANGVASVSSGGVNNYSAGGAGGAASVSNNFSAAGFFQSIAGQSGSTANVAQTTSTTTFLQGGVGAFSTRAVSQYGYTRGNLNPSIGYSLIQPILVGVGDNQNSGSAAPSKLPNGFGVGGGGTNTVSTAMRYGSAGGGGLCVIVTW
jgi:hypothetical protein